MSQVPVVDAVHPPEPTSDDVDAGYREFTGADVPAWHYPMMNDLARNAGYSEALRHALGERPGQTVLDIGAGSGLLAMLAARHGAGRVVSCEEVPSIADAAREIVARNGYADRVSIVNRLSTRLEVGRDLPERADLLVTEIFDDGLLGERAYLAISDARERLLKPSARIIPCAAKAWAVLLESREIWENHRIGTAEGFDLSAFNELATEAYLSYHLDQTEHRALCEPFPIFDFDFREYPGDRSQPIDTSILVDGTCHGVAYWYELRLDERTVVRTTPGLKPRSSWRQAIRLIDEPRTVCKGQRVSLTAHHDSESIWFTGGPA